MVVIPNFEPLHTTRPTCRVPEKAQFLLIAVCLYLCERIVGNVALLPLFELYFVQSTAIVDMEKHSNAKTRCQLLDLNVRNNAEVVACTQQADKNSC